MLWRVGWTKSTHGLIQNIFKYYFYPPFGVAIKIIGNEKQRRHSAPPYHTHHIWALVRNIISTLKIQYTLIPVPDYATHVRITESIWSSYHGWSSSRPLAAAAASRQLRPADRAAASGLCSLTSCCTLGGATATAQLICHKRRFLYSTLKNYNTSIYSRKCSNQILL